MKLPDGYPGRGIFFGKAPSRRKAGLAEAMFLKR
jgi:hypothetical protein